MTNKQLTLKDVHICLSCEHHQFCRMAQVIEQTRAFGLVEIPSIDDPDMENPEDPFWEYYDKDAEYPVFAGMQICFRHSSGDPRYTKGMLE